MAKPKKRRWRLKTNIADLYAKLKRIIISSKLTFWKLLLISFIFFLHQFLPSNSSIFVNGQTNDKLYNSTDLLLQPSSNDYFNSPTMTTAKNNIKFEKLSRQIFDSLTGTNVEDAPIDPPEWAQLSLREKKLLRKQLRKRNKKAGLPGGRQVYGLATREDIKPGQCRIMQMKQRVRMEGCAPKMIINNFCYGQCNSFFIPKLSRNKRLRTAFESCSVCQPSEFAPITVTLDCPARSPPYVEQQIMTIKNCSCKAVCKIVNDLLFF